MTRNSNRPVNADVERVLEAVAHLRTTGAIQLPENGIDLSYQQGVQVRCRACGVTWRVSRARYRCAGWWTCPSGCRTSNNRPTATPASV